MYKFYDFIEGICRSLAHSTNPNARERSTQFEGALNEFFVDERIGWQLIDCEIVTRGTLTFESSTHDTVEALEAAGRVTARDEIHEALSDLSRRT